jgi:hypothetical protein
MRLIVSQGCSENGIDIAPALPVKKDRCRVTGIVCGKARSDNTWLYFEEIEGNVINAVILSGAALLHDSLALNVLLRLKSRQLSLSTTARCGSFFKFFLSAVCSQSN